MHFQCYIIIIIIIIIIITITRKRENLPIQTAFIARQMMVREIVISVYIVRPDVILRRTMSVSLNRAHSSAAQGQKYGTGPRRSTAQETEVRYNGQKYGKKILATLLGLSH